MGGEEVEADVKWVHPSFLPFSFFSSSSFITGLVVDLGGVT